MIIYVGDLDSDDRGCYCPECGDPVASTTVDELCADCQELMNADVADSESVTILRLSRTA